jgi:hypothetical protein
MNSFDIGQQVIVATRIVGERHGRVVALSNEHDMVGVEIHEYPGSLLWVEPSQLMLSRDLDDVIIRLKRRIVDLGGGSGDRITV